jgi:hypothetical protein
MHRIYCPSRSEVKDLDGLNIERSQKLSAGSVGRDLMAKGIKQAENMLPEEAFIRTVHQ